MESLPNEVLVVLFAYVRTRDRCRLALVSRRIRQLIVNTAQYWEWCVVVDYRPAPLRLFVQHAAPFLKTLRIRNTTRALSMFKRCRAVTRLYYDVAVTEARVLRQIGNSFPRLESLALTLDDGLGVAPLHRLRHLRKLVLSNVRIFKPDLLVELCAANWSRLERLTLHIVYFEYRCNGALIACLEKYDREMHALTLKGEIGGGVYETLPRCTNLKWLCCHDTIFLDSRRFDCIAQMKNLEELVLVGISTLTRPELMQFLERAIAPNLSYVKLIRALLDEDRFENLICSRRAAAAHSWEISER